MQSQSFPRDKDKLIKELDLQLRLGDIRRAQNLKSTLAPKWWETGVLLFLFASALGLLASLYHWAKIDDKALSSWMLFWFVLMVLSVVFSFEFLLIKIYNLRRSNDVLLRMVEDTRKQYDTLDKRLKTQEEKLQQSLISTQEAVENSS